MKNSILCVVEDDPEMRELVVQVLASLPGVDVLDFVSGEDALAELEGRSPSILVADLGLPGMSGIELIARSRKLWPHLPVLVTTGNRSLFQVELARYSFVEIWEKPYPIRELRERVHSILVASETQAFAPFGAIDYLQMAGFGHHDLVLEVTLRDGRRGQLEIVGGEVWSCRLGDLWGQAALQEVLAGETRQVDFSPLEESPEQRMIGTPTRQILAEFAHIYEPAAGGPMLLPPTANADSRARRRDYRRAQVRSRRSR